MSIFYSKIGHMSKSTIKSGHILAICPDFVQKLDIYPNCVHFMGSPKKSTINFDILYTSWQPNLHLILAAIAPCIVRYGGNVFGFGTDGLTIGVDLQSGCTKLNGRNSF